MSLKVGSKSVLATDSVVELRIAVWDPSLYIRALASEDGTTTSFAGSVSRPGGTSLELYTVRGVSSDALESVADRREDIDSVTTLAEHDDEQLLEGEPIESLVVRPAAFGASVQSMTADDGVELLAHGRRDRPQRTATELQADLSSALTDRQHEALQKSYAAGFFEWPRPVDGDVLADSMGVSRPTFHQHLRVAERKVPAELFEDDPN